MARKSRNQMAMELQSKEKQVEQRYRTAVYARLSNETDASIVRETIQNQINFLTGYVGEQTGMELYDVYMDDDITGTRFDRPEFERMMGDMRTGRINCIVVKDLSRLGRDYLETGNLIERVFPTFHLRFVAVTDGFDSARDDIDMLLPVKNLVNELYAKDISKKICSSKQAATARGEHTGGIPVYGYMRNPEDNTKIIIDPEPAAVVKRIFEMSASGISEKEIAGKLNKEGIMTPYQYKNRHKPEKLAERQHLEWNKSTVHKTLAKEVYKGVLILGRQKQCLYKNQKSHRVPKEEWAVYENHHEAIVSDELFSKANSHTSEEIRKKMRDIGNMPTRTDDLLKGKIFCAHCGCKMATHHVYTGRIYHCSRKDKYGKHVCPVTPVKMQVVEETTLSVTKMQMKLYLDNDSMLRQLKDSRKSSSKKAALLDSIEERRKEVEKCAEMKSGLYGDHIEGLINESEYLLLNREYTKKMERLNKDIEELSALAFKYEGSQLENSSLAGLIKKYKGKRKLTREMADAFISKVLVHEDKELEIVFSYEDELSNMAALRKEMEAESW